MSIQDNIDTTSAIGRLFFKIMASIAEFEKDVIRERTKAGLEAARARGRVGGRPKKDENKVEMAIRMYQSKEYTIKEISEATGLSKTTMYRYIQKKRPL